MKVKIAKIFYHKIITGKLNKIYDALRWSWLKNISYILFVIVHHIAMVNFLAYHKPTDYQWRGIKIHNRRLLEPVPKT